MQGLTRRWVLSESVEPPAAMASLGLAPIVQRVLASRGLTEPAEVRRYCAPRLTDLAEPDLLPGVEAACDRLVAALRGGESIVIYGDYDVDGITATAILYHVLRTIDPAARVSWYVPHRLEEGYGLNPDALQRLREGGADVVVSVDCGITAVEPAAVARSIGLDLIITDHHQLPPAGAPLPDAFALVHPGLPDSRHGFAELCGAGVAYKLAWRLATRWCGSIRVSDTLQQTLLQMLPLVALATIADVVPLVGENRVLASWGLRLIKQTTLPGLRALLEASDLMGEQIDCQKVGYVLGPRLNACGRMGHAADAVRLLTDATPDEASEIAARLTRLNRERQQTERDIVDEAAQRAEQLGMTRDDRRVIVLADEQWHPGVIGIVCSRLVERFGRPAVLLQRHENMCRGSARSIEGYSIHAGLQACAEHLERFGGHEAAAGLSLRADRLDDLIETLTGHANAHITVEQLTPRLPIDCDAWLHEFDLAAVKSLATLSPFGHSNRRPTVRVRDAIVAEPPRPMGSQGRHLMLRLRQDHPVHGRTVIRTVWWGSGERAAALASGARVDVAIEPKINVWNGRTNVEGELRDVCVL